MVGEVRMDKARWLGHENLFGKITIEEGIMDIKLMNRPMRRDCYGENDTDGCWSNNWAKCIKVVNAFGLVISFSN